MNFYLRDSWVRVWLIGSVISAAFCGYHLLGHPNISHYFERAPATVSQANPAGATAVDYAAPSNDTVTAPGKTKTPGRWIVDLLGAPDSDTTMFQKALLSANPGDLIILRSGTHTGSLLPNHSVTIRGEGTPERPVVIRANNEPFARIESGEVQLEHLTVEQNGSTEPAILVHGGKLILRGVEVKSLSSSGVVLDGGSVNAETTSFTSKENGAKVSDGSFECLKCKFLHNNNYGLIVNAVRAATVNIADSVFSENGLDGATVGNPGITTFTRCEFRANQKDGLTTRGEKTAVTLRFSELVENKYNGVVSSGNSIVDVTNCKINRNGAFGVSSRDKSVVTLTGCDLNQNGTSDVQHEGAAEVKVDRGIAAEPKTK